MSEQTHSTIPADPASDPNRKVARTYQLLDECSIVFMKLNELDGLFNEKFVQKNGPALEKIKSMTAELRARLFGLVVPSLGSFEAAQLNKLEKS